MKRIYLLAIGVCICLCGKAQLKTISLERAQSLAAENYPKFRSLQLRSKAQQRMQSAAYDIGMTEISTGAEEKGHDNPDGITNLITIRQGLDILGISARKKYLKSQTEVAEAVERVEREELFHQICLDYDICYIAMQKAKTYAEMDSVYANFQEYARKRFEVQDCGQLEMLSAQNQARKVELSLQQAQADVRMALQNLNRWFCLDSVLYCPDNWLDQIPGLGEQRPSVLIALSEKQVEAADGKVKAERSEFLPKLFAEYSSQKIGNTSGYSAWSVGMSVPLFYGAQKARTQSARLESMAVRAEQEFLKDELENNRRQRKTELDKWKQSVAYYKDTALPLSTRQQAVALQTYQAGETDYMTFTQSMKEAMQTRLDYLDCYQNYLITLHSIIYDK